MLRGGGSRLCVRLGVRNARWFSSNVPDDSDLWVVEGMLMSVQDVRTIKRSEEEQYEERRQRNFQMSQHLSRVHLPAQEDQKMYWSHYMKVYERGREEWEELVWDKPVNTRNVDDYFFDAPLREKKKTKKRPEPKKPFSMEEIQAAIRENVRPPVSKSKIEYRTAADSKWPF